jgi:hypothetical protein
VNDQWSLPDCGGSNCDAGECILAVRNIVHSLATEAFEGTARRPEDAFEVVHANARNEDAGVGLHALHGRFADRLPVFESTHGG